MVAENFIYGGNWQKNFRADGWIGHEMGHVIDLALNNGSSPEFIDSRFSDSPEFKAAYNADLAKILDMNSTLPPDQLIYLLQPGRAGRQETFAEVFGSLFGTSSNKQYSEENLRLFPSVAALVRKQLATLK